MNSTNRRDNKNFTLLENYQIDYILIWGHGLLYKNQIIQLIEKEKNLEILHTIYHYPKKISHFIKVVYSYDYAPYKHLISKTKYLNNTSNKIFLIFLINKKPNNDYRGEGSFRHLESMTIKELKEDIRNKYNPYNNNKRSEDHVIHASDNEYQTDYILRYLGYENGIYSIISSSKLIKIPYHLGQIRQFQIKKIKTKDIYCRIIQGCKPNISTKIVPVKDSPHFKSIVSKNNEYQNYLDLYQGDFLLDYYSSTKFFNLEKKLQYLKGKYSNCYIITEKISNNKYLIIDGLHRASILIKKNHKEIIVIIKK